MSDTAPTKFSILAYTGGKLHVDGFDDPVVVDLNGLDTDETIPIALKHDTDDATILGQSEPDQIHNDGQTLTIDGEITADPDLSPSVERVIAMAAKGHKWQASIGAQIEASHEVAAGETVHVNGQDLEGPFILATQSVLRETSVLGMGADRKTSVSFSAAAKLHLTAEAKSKTMDEDNDVDAAAPESTDNAGFETWCKDTLQQDPASLSEQARSALLQQYAAVSKDTNDQVDAAAQQQDTSDDDEASGNTDVDAEAPPCKPMKANAKGNAMKKKPLGGDGASTDSSILKARLKNDAKAEANEIRRRAAIKAKCKGDDLLCAKAIEAGWSADKAELEYIKRQRPQAPAGHVNNHQPTDMLRALQGAMILRAKGQLDHAAYSGEYGLALDLPKWLRAGINSDQRQKAMEAAWKFRDMSMVDLCRAAAAIDGGRSQYLDGSNRGFIRAAVSGGALADIFTTNINAVFIQKLLEAPDTTAGWTSESDANNFQTMERTRLTKGPKLTSHNRGGTADSATRSDIKEQYKIARYSQVFKVDEMDIIDDRFEALQDIPNEMGLACARMRPDLVYSILLANANLQTTSQPLFSASQPGSQSNLVASGGTLTAATLQAGMAAMFNFLEGTTGLNLYPTHIIVPMVLAGLAFNLLQGQNVALAGISGTPTQLGSLNPLVALQNKFGQIQVVTDQRLTNGVVDPNTGTSYAGNAATWRLASNRCKTIEVAYLKGSGRAPQVRQFMLDQGQWGIGWDCALDIGAKALEWRGFYQATT